MQPKANFLTRNQKDILKARHRHERDKSATRGCLEKLSSRERIILTAG
jgi:FixJ family two-component response regulator